MWLFYHDKFSNTYHISYLATSGIMPSACHAHDGELMGIIYTVILYDPTVTTVNRAIGRWSC